MSSLENDIPCGAKGCDPVTIMVEPKTTEPARPSYESYAGVTSYRPCVGMFELRAS